MQAIIDRFEGDFAVVEYEKKMYNLPTIFLPRNAKEGDVLEIGVSVERSKTDELKKEISQLMKDVWE